MSDPVENEPAGAGDRRGNRLLLMVAGAFALLLAGWGTFIFLAHRHPVQNVPVVTRGGTQARP